MSAKTQVQQKETEGTKVGRGNPEALTLGIPIEQLVEAAVKKEIAALNGSVPKFSADDRDFLIWMTGFTAGANLERDGARGERIFARCREIRETLFSTPHANPS